MHGQRLDAVKQLTGGIEFLFKKNKVEWLKGLGTFTGANTVKVGDRTVTAKNIVLATGSSVTPLPGVEIDQKVVVDSTGALELPKVPEHMVVIGGGVIGLELGSVWRRLGAKVTCVEFLDQILPGFDGDVRKEANKIFKKQGFDFRLGTKVTKVEVSGGKATSDDGAGEGRRGRDDRGRLRARLDRPQAQHRRARPRHHRPSAQPARPDRDRP